MASWLPSYEAIGLRGYAASWIKERGIFMCYVPGYVALETMLPVWQIMAKLGKMGALRMILETFEALLGNRAGVFILRNFHLGWRYRGWKNRELGNQASPLSHIKRENFCKGLVARSLKPGSYEWRKI